MTFDLIKLWLLLVSCITHILLVIFSIDGLYRHVWRGCSIKWLVFGGITLSIALLFLFLSSVDAYKLALKTVPALTDWGVEK